MKPKHKGELVSRGGSRHQNRIGAIRVSRGLTRKALSIKLACHDSQVFKLERGDTPLTLDWMYRLCKALNCTLPELAPEWELSDVKMEIIEQAWAELGPEAQTHILQKIAPGVLPPPYGPDRPELSGNLPIFSSGYPLIKVVVRPDGTYEAAFFGPNQENLNPISAGETKQKDK